MYYVPDGTTKIDNIKTALHKKNISDVVLFYFLLYYRISIIFSKDLLLYLFIFRQYNI